MSSHIGPNADLEHGAFGGQHLQSIEEANLFPEQDKHRLHNPSHRFLLYNIYFNFMIVHLLVALRAPLQVYLVYPYRRNRTIV
jgi:hypothetical protein